MTNLMVADKNCFKTAKRDEKIAFITILCMLAGIDNNIKSEEIEYINDLADEMNISIMPTFFTYPQEL